MSYYMLPKNINDIIIQPFFYNEMYNNNKITVSNECNTPYMSYSLINYYNVLKQQIDTITINNHKHQIYQNDDDKFTLLCNITNSHHYIYSTITGKETTISNLDIKNYIFYDLFELLFHLNIKDCIKDPTNLNIGYFTNHFFDLTECFKIYMNNYSNEYTIYNHLFNSNKELEKEFDLGFFQLDENKNITDILEILLIIIKRQTNGGNMIIQIGDINKKMIVDIIYLLSSLYDKLYICKPSTSNLLNNHKYIVCKSFIKKQPNLDANINIIYSCLSNKNVKSLFNYDIPYYFKNKINEINIIIGQQQLEIMEQIISIYKSKNKDDKIEALIKNNIQNSINWCEKHKIPYNKLFDKSRNIFHQIQV